MLMDTLKIGSIDNYSDIVDPDQTPQHAVSHQDIFNWVMQSQLFLIYSIYSMYYCIHVLHKHRGHCKSQATIDPPEKHHLNGVSLAGR